jgi:transposase
MSNVLSDDKKQQVLALGRLGWPLRRIEEATGVRRETASAYLRAAGVAVRPPRGWGRLQPKPANDPSPDSGAKPANDPSPDSGAKPANDPSPDPDAPAPWQAPARSPVASACESYRELIEEALRRGRNAKAIWQDLVDDHGFKAEYASVKRFVRRLRGSAVPEAHGIVITQPGEEGQVDYGTGPMVRHPETGSYRRTRLFVLTLGFSRKSVRFLTFKSSSRIWAELHERAFRRLGCAPKIIVLDNLREGVLTPDVYEPRLNPLFRDVLKHYGVVALPCRVRDPDRKGKVESGVGHAQRTPLQGQRFESLEEAQAYLDRWEERWADTRIHGTTKRQVSTMFDEERPALLPLPVEPFRYYEHGERTVHLDGCVEVDGAYYSAPPGRIGVKLPVQWSDRFVRLLDPRTGQLLVEHEHQRRGSYRLRPEHRPASTPVAVIDLLTRADMTGRHVGDLCRAIHRNEDGLGARKILGVLSLAKKHGPTALNEACEAALEAGAATYRCVRRFLERRPQTALTLKQVDPLIRELTHYRALIQERTNDDDKETT